MSMITVGLMWRNTVENTAVFHYKHEPPRPVGRETRRTSLLHSSFLKPSRRQLSVFRRQIGSPRFSRLPPRANARPDRGAFPAAVRSDAAVENNNNSNNYAAGVNKNVVVWPNDDDDDDVRVVMVVPLRRRRRTTGGADETQSGVVVSFKKKNIYPFYSRSLLLSSSSLFSSFTRRPTTLRSGRYAAWRGGRREQ